LYDGEMMLHHRAEDGTKVIISFMLEMDEEAQPNEFIN